MVQDEVHENLNVPVLPLRDVVLFPGMVIPLFVGRALSIKAIDFAMEKDKIILMVMQKAADIDDPKPDDLCAMGCIANILQILKLPDGTVKVLVEGIKRAKIISYDEDEKSCMQANVQFFSPTQITGNKDEEALIRIAINQLEQYAKLNKKNSS